MKKIFKKSIVISIISFVLPSFIFAATVYSYSPATGVGGFLPLVSSWLTLAFPIVVSLAVVWFSYNIFQYMIVDTEAEKTVAKNQMVWGLIAIFVMVSIWGFIGVLRGTFFGGNTISASPTVVNDVLTPLGGVSGSGGSSSVIPTSAQTPAGSKTWGQIMSDTGKGLVDGVNGFISSLDYITSPSKW